MTHQMFFMSSTRVQHLPSSSTYTTQVRMVSPTCSLSINTRGFKTSKECTSCQEEMLTSWQTSWREQSGSTARWQSTSPLRFQEKQGSFKQTFTHQHLLRSFPLLMLNGHLAKTSHHSCMSLTQMLLRRTQVLRKDKVTSERKSLVKR